MTMAMLREIRVRPVIRYAITDYVEDAGVRRSIPLGEFDNVTAANRVAAALAYEARVRDRSRVTLEPARALRVDAIRAPGLPHPAIRWELREVSEVHRA